MERQRIQYDILSATNRKSLIEIVEEYNAKGWMPYGPPVYGEEVETDFIWHQAIIREKGKGVA